MRRAIQCLVQYLEETTIHGLRYLSVGRGLEKFVWFIVIAISFSIAGYLIQTTIQENENEPVLTKTLKVQKVGLEGCVSRTSNLSVFSPRNVELQTDCSE